MATSKAQWRFLKAVAAGKLKKKGLSRQKAAEMLGEQTPKGLPARKKKKGG